MMTEGFPAQRASNVDSIFMSWYHHVSHQWLNNFIEWKTVIPLNGILLPLNSLNPGGWGRDKMAAISTQNFPISFLQWKFLHLYWDFFLEVQLTICQHCIRKWLDTKQVTTQGLYLLKTHCLASIGIPIINLRWSNDHLKFIMGIPIPIRWCLLSEWRPCWPARIYTHQPT